MAVVDVILVGLLFEILKTLKLCILIVMSFSIMILTIHIEESVVTFNK